MSKVAGEEGESRGKEGACENRKDWTIFGLGGIEFLAGRKRQKKKKKNPDLEKKPGSGGGACPSWGSALEQCLKAKKKP